MRYFTLSLMLFAAVLTTECSAVEEQEVPEKFSDLENLKVFPAEPEPAGEITLTHDATYGDTDEVILGQFLSDIEVDEKGRVYMGDLRAATIQVYNPDGSYLRSLGRSGRGPGEFLQLRQIRTSGDRLHALDPGQSKISIFDLDAFDHIEDISIAIPSDSLKQPSWYRWVQENRLFYEPADFETDSDGRYLITFSPNGVGPADNNLDIRTWETSLFDPVQKEYERDNLLSFPWTGQVLIHTTGDRTGVMFGVPYKYSSQYDYSGGSWVYGWTEDLLFRFHDEEGSYREAWYYSRPKKELTMDGALAFYDNPRQKEMVRDDDLPETLPQFKSLLLDDEGRLWVSLLTENRDELEWWILDREGQLLATVTRPSNESFQTVKNGHLYTRIYDPETGLQQVLRYRIE